MDRQPTSQHQFPITRDAKSFSRQATNRLKGISDEHRAIIEATQPYHAHDDGSGRPQALIVLNTCRIATSIGHVEATFSA
jgi:hypothetical protein